jgi:hypothetical protein
MCLFRKFHLQGLRSPKTRSLLLIFGQALRSKWNFMDTDTKELLRNKLTNLYAGVLFFNNSKNQQIVNDWFKNENNAVVGVFLQRLYITLIKIKVLIK